LATIVLEMTHSPDQCPSSNSTIRKMTATLGAEMPKLSKKFGLKFVAGPYVTNEHRIVAIVETQKVENLSDFLLESGLLQWNSTHITPAQPMDEGIDQINKLKPLY